MAFYSILFPCMELESRAREHPWLDGRMKARKTEGTYIWRGNKMMAAPAGFDGGKDRYPGLYVDVNLDRIIEEVLSAESDGDLKELFFHFCPDVKTALYRHAVMRDLEREQVRDAFGAFQQSMLKAERLFAYGKQAHCAAQRDKYAADGVALYCRAVRELTQAAGGLPVASEGLRDFLNVLTAYAGGGEFAVMETASKAAEGAMESITYRLRVEEGFVCVDIDSEASDYVQALAGDLFVPGNLDAKEERLQIRTFRQAELCPLEVLIMNALAERHPLKFRAVREAAAWSHAVPEPFAGRFAKELRFYFRYLDMMSRLRGEGMAFSYPVFAMDGTVSIQGAYDLALALDKGEAVPNDFFLGKEEMGAAITGANQGGKTTFLRSLGQVAVLAALGLPIPCESARIRLYRSIYSQFSEPEDATVNNGKLKEELLRLRPILRAADGDSLVLLNELFSSATAKDAADMAERVLLTLTDACAHVVCVTHIGGLACPGIVSMVAQVGEDGRRLYRIVREKAGGRAHAASIARAYHLTYDEIKERIGHEI